jgi:hypothetical protein
MREWTPLLRRFLRSEDDQVCVCVVVVVACVLGGQGWVRCQSGHAVYMRVLSTGGLRDGPCSRRTQPSSLPRCALPPTYANAPRWSCC